MLLNPIMTQAVKERKIIENRPVKVLKRVPDTTTVCIFLNAGIEAYSHPNVTYAVVSLYNEDSGALVDAKISHRIINTQIVPRDVKKTLDSDLKSQKWIQLPKSGAQGSDGSNHSWYTSEEKQYI